MHDEVTQLIDLLKRGQFEDPTEKIALLAAALIEHRAGTEFLMDLLKAPQVLLCLAAIDACKNRTEPELFSAITGLSAHDDSRVRLKVVDRIDPLETPEAFTRLLTDTDSDIREAAIKKMSGNSAFGPRLAERLAKDSSWYVRKTAAEALGTLRPEDAVAALGRALAADANHNVKERCTEQLERWLEELGPQALENWTAPPSDLRRIESYFKEDLPDGHPLLSQWISSQSAGQVDAAALTRFGVDLTDEARKGSLPGTFGADETVAHLETLVRRNPVRSIALVGDPGTGKTAAVNELVRRLDAGAEPWRVLRVSPTEFLAGTKWLGEWQSKLHDLVQAIRAPRRVVLYVPNLHELTTTGVTSSSESSVASALAPFLEDGSVLLLGECTSEDYAENVAKAASFSRLLDKVMVREPDTEHTRAILHAVRDGAPSLLDDHLLDHVLEWSEQYLHGSRRPGNAVSLLRELLRTEDELGRPVTAGEALQTLSRSTGVPVRLLDDAEPLKEREVKEFFTGRIIGQNEAIEAVTDLVLLIKAGLTDPQKPSGIMLFTGPTGVGKTELARALAEFIFGNATRLKRFDMSEYADASGFQRLIGTRGEGGKLTDAVREHPFSVILLDEIEKAHLNVFDLCLQLFDAGRLTDGNGKTVDFRRSIIILTSNIGAPSTTAPLGFGAASAVFETDHDRTFKELSRFFRPEFLNRIDRIVPFQPLSLQVAEQIARREINLVLRRSGIRRRSLVVEVDPTAVALLVREGYSPHFGARPLKRVVERLLLLPLSRTIAEGSLAGSAVLKLTERQGRIEVVMAKVAETAALPPALVALDDQLAALEERFSGLDASVLALADRKSALLELTHQTEFYNDARLRQSSLGEIHNLEQFLLFHERVARTLGHLRSRLTASPKPEAKTLKEDLRALASDIRHLGLVSRSREGDFDDVVLVLTLVDRTGKDLRSVERLAEMYRAFAVRHRLTAEVLGEIYDDNRDQVFLSVSGLGAFGLMKTEAGLHQIVRRYQQNLQRSGREVRQEDRELVRVELWAAGGSPQPAAVKTEVSSLKPSRKRLLNATQSVSVFDAGSVRSLEFWTGGPRDKAVQNAVLVLQAQLGTPLATEPGIVRQYDVGLAPGVKDYRTGLSSERIEKIFRGELGVLLGYDDDTGAG